MSRFVATVLVVTILAVGCSPTLKQVEEVEVREVVPFEPNEVVRPIEFTKIVVKLPRGERIGMLQGGLLCIDQSPLTWRGGRITLTGDQFTEAFREELEKANCPVVGDPNSLFEDTSAWRAEFLVAGLIQEMKANVCYPYMGMGDHDTAKGSAYMKVDWQVYSRLQRRVTYEASTEGVSNVTAEIAGGDTQMFMDAFAMATQNLLGDEGFRKVVVRPREQDVNVPSEKIRLRSVEEFATRLSDHISRNRMSVVTVFAGDGHGSGFFISEEGHLLTNEHVVRDARFVTIKLITGRELVGEVLRTNRVRDVAVVKVEEKDMVPLPIRRTSPNVGDDVYVLGSPLEEELNATLTKGVVSGFRKQNDQRFIQSDASTLPGCSGGPLLDSNGNVIGVAAIGLYTGGMAPMGVNFFVPIDEALQSVNVAFDRTE